MSASNSEFFLASEFTVVNNDKIIFKVHKLGYITCVCGKVIQNHECLLLSDVGEIKFKFQLCSESACRFCEPTVQWHYERYFEKDGKTHCRKCENEIPEENTICHGCFCKECFFILNECVCCKFCIGTQCVCADETISVGSD